MSETPATYWPPAPTPSGWPYLPETEPGVDWSLLDDLIDPPDQPPDQDLADISETLDALRQATAVLSVLVKTALPLDRRTAVHLAWAAQEIEKVLPSCEPFPAVREQLAALASHLVDGAAIGAQRPSPEDA